MKNILVPVDLSETTAETLATALALAQTSGGTIMLFHVVASPYLYSASPGHGYDAWEKDMIRAQRSLGQLLAAVRLKGIHGSGKVVAGDPGQEIVSHARDYHADVIVMGSRGHTALYDLIAGGTSARVLKGAPCPVMLSGKPKAARAEADLAKAC